MISDGGVRVVGVYVPVIGVRGDMCDVGTVASGNEEAWP